MSLRRTLDVLAATVERASAVPFSGSCLVNRAEVLSLVERARVELPVEFDEAAALLVAHQEVIDRGEAAAGEMLAQARARADEMVGQSALVATARGRSDQILDAARTEAARLLREADEYCDHRLAGLEHDLERAMAQVRRGRERLWERSALGIDAGDRVGSPSADDGPSDQAGPELPERAGSTGVDRLTPGEGGDRVPADRREPVAVGAGVAPGHRVVDLAAMERAEAERAGLGHHGNLQ